MLSIRRTPVSPNPSTSLRLTGPLLVAIALLFALLTAGPASAADKPFSVVLSNADGSTPATLVAGSQGTVKATYRNLNSQQQLGSSNLVVPAGLRVVSASSSQGSATVSGGTVQLRDLNLAPLASLVVTMQVDAGCTAANYTWAPPVTKQANNFNGPPGNDYNFNAAASDMRTVVTGGCRLRFVTQPANARVSQAITGAAYNPTGPALSVEVIDGSGVRVTSSTASVTMAIGTNAGGGTLAGTKTVSASSGLASFSTLNIDKPGTGYTLVASSPGMIPDTSGPFEISQYAVACLEDIDCTLSLNLPQSSNSKLDVTAVQGPTTDTDAGFLTSSFGVGGPLDCAGYAEFTPDVVDVNYSVLDREKLVAATIDKRIMNAQSNNGASFLESCFGAPYTFATKPGTPLEVNTAYVPGPYPAPEYKGLLPDCGGQAQLDDPSTPGVSGPLVSNAGAPCVTKRKKLGAGDGFIESRWPSGRQAGVSDPRGHY